VPTRKGRRIAAALVLGGMVLATGWGLWAIRPVLAPFLIAVVIAYLVAPLVNALANMGLSRTWSIVVIYGILLGAAFWGVSELVPELLTQTRRLTEAIPTYSMRARELVEGLHMRLDQMGAPVGLQEALARNILEAEVRTVAALERLVRIETVQHLAGFFISLLLAPILAAYLLKDMDRFKERFVLMLPRGYRMEILALLRGLDKVLSGFVRGQVLLALLVGMMATGATSLLGLRYALLLGLWAALCELVPYIGPLLGAIPAVLFGLTVSPLLGIQVAVAYLIIQQIENLLLAPKVMGDSLGLHPLVVIFSILVGGFLWGIWGMILALPVVGVINVLWIFTIARLTEGPPLEP